MPAKTSLQRSLNLRVDRRAVDVDCAVRVRAVKALRVAPPALRAADDLDRASRELQRAIIDDPGKPLDDLHQRRYRRILFDGCAPRSPLRIARCGARRTGGRRSRFVLLFRLTPWLPFARQHVRESRDRSGSAL
jgi:hypothetical protein